jgi:hypothetical protein
MHIIVDLIHPLRLLQVDEIHSHHLHLQAANLRGLRASLLQQRATLPNSWVFKQSSSFLFLLPSTTTNDHTTFKVPTTLAPAYDPSLDHEYQRKAKDAFVLR